LADGERSVYLRSVEIDNIRAIQHLNWRLTPRMPYAGWHVVVGDNGSGKSSFLKAIGLALIGPNAAYALRQPWEQWRRQESEYGRIRLEIVRDPSVDQPSGKGRRDNLIDFSVTVMVGSEGVYGKSAWGTPTEHDIWGNVEGWFSASYGPFRRFRGGDPEYKTVSQSLPRLGRHLSLFDESVALSECLEWLQTLRFKQLEKDPEGAILKPLIRFINQKGFLPFEVKLHSISSTSVKFVDGNGAEVDVENLSDGYRSILSMTFELIRQMAATYGADAVFDPDDPSRVIAPGVVLIDEIDAHLHPTWQRRVGVWFREHFPNIQFIVTTHSPIICQAADPGSVYRLPAPGTDENGRFIRGDELKRLIYGNILDAYGTEVFGDGITRSAKSRELLEELATLNVKETRDGLDADEKRRQRELQRILPTSAYETPNGK
jgi:energy-coupling factor transporter ATP-binding protein EcfA2